MSNFLILSHLQSSHLLSFLSPHALSCLPSLFPSCLSPCTTDIAASSVVSVATGPLELQVLPLLLPPHPLQRTSPSPLIWLRQNLYPAEMHSLKLHSQNVNLVIAGSSSVNVVPRKYTKHTVHHLKMTFCLFHQVGKGLWVSLL